jgi:hypothetical protein
MIKNMNKIKTKKTIANTYAIISLLILLLDLLSSDSLANSPPNSVSGYFDSFLGLISWAAIYGLFSARIASMLDKDPKAGKNYFLGALVLGTAITIIVFAGAGIDLNDCIPHCSDYTAQVHTARVAAAMATVPLILTPALIHNYFRKK